MTDIDSRDAFRLDLPLGVALVFEKRNDRFFHYIERTHGKSQVRITESIEGDDSQLWPTSPPLQEIANHREAEQKVLLGVGRAGRSHWSIAVSTVASKADGPLDSFRFEVACRTRDVPEQLASSYRVFEEPQGAWQILPPNTQCAAQQDSNSWACHLHPTRNQSGTFVWTYQWTANP